MLFATDSKENCKVTNKLIQCHLHCSSKRETAKGRQSRQTSAILSTSQAPHLHVPLYLLSSLGAGVWSPHLCCHSCIHSEMCGSGRKLLGSGIESRCETWCPVSLYLVQSIGDICLWLSSAQDRRGKAVWDSYTARLGWSVHPVWPWSVLPAAPCDSWWERNRSSVLQVPSYPTALDAPGTWGVRKFPAGWLEPKPGSSAPPPDWAEAWPLSDWYPLG